MIDVNRHLIWMIPKSTVFDIKLYFLFQLIEGNKNTYASVINDLHPPIITRYIRLLPITKLSPTVCMRVELYGCPWEGRMHRHTPTQLTLASVR